MKLTIQEVCNVGNNCSNFCGKKKITIGENSFGGKYSKRQLFCGQPQPNKFYAVLLAINSRHLLDNGKVPEWL